MWRRFIGIGLVAGLSGAAALGSACSSNSAGSAVESDSGAGADTTGGPSPDASPWCLTDESENPNVVVDECSRNPGECLIGATGVSSCPIANLLGCCKGTASSPGGTDNEICIYEDDYLQNDGGVGAKPWCTCTPPTTGCFYGTWQSSP